MTYTIKPLGPQTDLDPATDVDSATTVHLVNTHSAAVVIVRSTSANVGIHGNMTACASYARRAHTSATLSTSRASA